MDKLEDRWSLIEKKLNHILDKYDTTLDKYNIIKQDTANQFKIIEKKNDKYVKIINKVCIGELIMAIAMLIIAIVK